MKKFYLRAAGSLVMASIAMNVAAQQLSNPGFENDWEIQVPYLSYRDNIKNDWDQTVGYTVDARTQAATKGQLIAPAGWFISNSTGMCLTVGTSKTLDNPIKVGNRVEGRNGAGYAVELTDTKAPAVYEIDDLYFPAYISLGTTWFNGQWDQKEDGIPFFGIPDTPASSKNRAHGTFGGAEYTSRPDAVAFYYNRPDATQDATVVAYLWKGTYTQEAVPALMGALTQVEHHIDYYGTEKPSVDMTDRDTHVLGMPTINGKEKTQSDDAELIAKLTARISETPADWTLFECPFEYLSDATPEKINIIIAAGDYFGKNEKFVDGNKITVDDVTLIYYSRLSSVKIDEVKYTMENGKYDYELDGPCPGNANTLICSVLGQGATIKSSEIVDGKIVVTVENNIGADIDGENTHVYTFSFNGEAVSADPAHELVNLDFENGWGIQVPYMSYRNNIKNDWVQTVGYTVDARTETATKGQLIAPEGWYISNSTGMSMTIGPSQTMENPIKVGNRVAGYSGKYAVELTDKKAPAAYELDDLYFPAYISLGTTWFNGQWTQKEDGIPFFGIPDTPASCENRAHGTFGGAKYEGRPDAVSFYYNRPDATQDGTLVAYLWKGTYTQEAVPALMGALTQVEHHIDYYGTEKPSVDMTNRDTHVLGMETINGKEKTQSDDAELIAKINTRIEGKVADWTLFECPFEYLSDATPEMLNIIIAAGDYFGKNEDFIDGNKMTVDNVNLVYYSRLKSINFNGTEYPVENGKYEYTLAGELPADLNAIECTVLGQSAAVKNIEAVDGKVLVTVENADGNDVDGKNVHVYTLEFGSAANGTYAGVVNGNAFGFIGKWTKEDGTMDITVNDDNTCTIVFHQLGNASGTEVGDMKFENVEMTEANGVISYKGSANAMDVMGGEINLTDITLTGTTTGNKAGFTVNAKYASFFGSNPFTFTFITEGYDAISEINVDEDLNAPVVYYNLQGVQVNAENLVPGIYVRRQGNKAEKIVIR